MDLVRFGRGIRALRMRRRWRQRDLAAAASVSQTLVTRIERGLGGSVPLAKLERIAIAVGAAADLRLSFNGEALDRLLDAAHAGLVEIVAGLLRNWGWSVIAEATFSIRGERGSIDLLAWHPALRIVLVVEVKSVIPDVQATLAVFDRKVRLASEIAQQRRGWDAVVVASLLVVAEDRTSRRRVDAHSAIFSQAFPHRSGAVRRWLAAPDPAEPLHGLWFLPRPQHVTPRHRVARPRGDARARARVRGRAMAVRELRGA
jgi:transcriptional regulator with XRE-family HTH domain